MTKTKELNLYSELLTQFLKVANAVRVDLEDTLFSFIFLFSTIKTADSALRKIYSDLFLESQPTKRKGDGLP